MNKEADNLWQRAVKTVRKVAIHDDAVYCMTVYRGLIMKERRWKETFRALEDIESGRVVDGKKVMTWLKSWGKENEFPSLGK